MRGNILPVHQDSMVVSKEWIKEFVAAAIEGVCVCVCVCVLSNVFVVPKDAVAPLREKIEALKIELDELRSFQDVDVVLDEENE
jgi:hypothetical protein